MYTEFKGKLAAIPYCGNHKLNKIKAFYSTHTFPQIGFGRGDQATEDVGFVLFAFFNVLWFSVYLEAWKRYCAELAYKWGTLDQRDELLQEPRPLFSVSSIDFFPSPSILSMFFVCSILDEYKFYNKCKLLYIR